MATVEKDIFVGEYLKRLQYTGPVEPNLQTLNELHKRHLLAFPFENLNNVYQQPYSSTKYDLFRKFIQGNRGGLCHENNSLFAFLLKDLGYDVIMCSAAVLLDGAVQLFSEMGSHQLSLVTLKGQQWMVDVGFGRSFTMPLQLTEDVIQDDLSGFYKLKNELNEDGDLIVKLFALWGKDRPDDLGDDNEWQCLYKFTASPRSLSYFDPQRKAVLENPKSSFNKGLISTILRPWGRITLSGAKLIKVYNENEMPVKKEVEILKTRQDVISTMDKEFGIKFDKQYYDKLDKVLGIKDSEIWYQVPFFKVLT